MPLLEGPPPSSTGPIGSKSTLCQSKSSSSEIVSLLQISPALTTRPKVVDLRLAYSKYTAHLRAQSEMHRMISDGTWPLEPVSTDDLIEIFVSKSVYHASYQKLFSKAQEYPQIIAWLLNDHDSPTSYDIFGLQKSVYTFKDLKAVLESLDASSSKGKRKASDDDGERERKKSKKASSSKRRYNSSP